MEGGGLTNCHTYPSFFSSETGVYSSKHPPRALPQDPLQDLVSFLFSHDHPGTTALVDSSSGNSISYRELKSLVSSTATGLRNAGVSAGQVVLLLLPNTILYPVLFLGALSAGAVATTMNPLSTTQEIKKSAGSCSPVLAFTSPDRTGEINALGLRAIAVPDALGFDPAEFSPFASVLCGGGGGPPRPEIRQADPACVLYSSGTSGLMKGVVLSHANLIAAAELFVRFEASQYYPAQRGWENVYLAALPMFHVYGLVLFAVGLLSLGSTVVVMRRFGAEEAARAIERFGVTHLPLVPPMLGSLMRARRATGCELRSLKQVSSGAAPLSNKLIQDFMRTFPHVDFIQGYGMTESTAVGTRGFNTEKLKKHNSVGLLAPNMQAKVLDCNSGACLPPGKSGELWLCGPGIMKGYLNDEKATSSTIDKNGWMETGDISYFDEDGYLYVLDRLKDIIKYKGYQIAPADLEAVLISHPEIIDVGVTSGEDEEDGEIPVAFVVRKPGSEFSADEVMKYVSQKVAPYKKVRRVVFVQSIPKSPTGKILRRLLRSNHGISRM